MTAIRINLLPHRELLRAAQQKTLIALAAIAAIAALLIVVAGHFVISGMQDSQEGRNAFLKGEITRLDLKIKEIAQLKEKTNALLARKQVVETLQVNRAEVVHLFDELARQLPEGIYLKSFKQAGHKLNMQGYAQSSARVSALMRNVETSEWMDAPKLIEVRSSNLNNLRVHEFILEAAQTVPNAAPAAGEPKKPGRP